MSDSPSGVDRPELARRMKLAREHFGLSQRGMAAKIGVSYPGWQRYESGASVPGGVVLAELFRLGVNVGWLLTGEGKMLVSDQQQADAPIDVAVLEEATEVIEVLLAEFQRVMDANTKAKVIARIYAYLVTKTEEAEAKRTAEVIRLFRDAS